MPKVRVHAYTTSVDGFVAGPDQSLDNPMGVGGRKLHPWMFDALDRDEGLDFDVVRAGDVNVGATIMGRNMFGPVRGPWGDEDWKGWWGEEPPYHHPVFVLTHHLQPPIAMVGTTFNFVDTGIEDALEQALAAADGQDVRIGGGASTVRQYLAAGLVDDLHLVISPVLLGSGERLFEGLATLPDGYDVAEVVSSPAVTHVHIAKK